MVFPTSLVRWLLWPALVLLSACAVSTVVPPAPTGHPITVLQDVSILDVRGGRMLEEQAIEIRGEILHSIQPSASYVPPAGAEVHRLSGGFVVPGFVDMHAHVLLHPWKEDGGLSHRYERAGIEVLLKLLLAHGITTVRDPGAPTEAAITFREMVDRGVLTGPAILTAGRILNSSDFDPEPFAVVRDEEAVRREVRWQAAAGVDFIKLYASMPPSLVRAAIDEAHARGLPVIGHLQRTTWTEAAELGIDGLCHAAPWSVEYLPEEARAGYPPNLLGRAYWLEHLDLEGRSVQEMIAALARRRVAVDSTLIAMHSKFWGNDPRYVRHPALELMPELYRRGWPKGSFTASWTAADHQMARKQWPKLLALTGRLHAGGVPLTVGTDTPTPWIIPGISFHEELELLASAGIPPADLLRMATLNAAIALRREGKQGEIRPGQRADLVVLGANPLEDIRHTRAIRAVMKAGRLHEPEDLLEPARR